MFHLAVIATTFTCIDAQILLDKMNEFKIEEETRAEMISIVIEETPHCEWDANADWRNGFYPPNPEDKPMAQVTYRGVKYDTEEYRKLILDEAQKNRNHDLMYRGVKVTKKLVTA